MLNKIYNTAVTDTSCKILWKVYHRTQEMFLWSVMRGYRIMIGLNIFTGISKSLIFMAAGLQIRRSNKDNLGIIIQISS